MSQSARKSPHPSVPPLYDEVLDDERSAVRPRTPRPEDPPPHHAQPRGDRVERKVRLAIILQDTLPPGDTRARLLRVAIVRRDEALLDALLKELRGAEPPAQLQTEPPPTSRTPQLGDTIPPMTRRPAQLVDELDARPRRFSTLLPPPPDDDDR